MLKKMLLVGLFLIFLPAFSGASESLNKISNAFGTGKVSGEIGVNFRIDDPDDSEQVDDGDIGTAFAELDFESNQFYNFSLGLNFIAVGELWSNDAWEKNGFDDDGNFERKSMLRYVYLDYEIPGTKSTIMVGRNKFEKSEAMDGDAHQGVQLTSNDLPMTTLYLAVIDRWINNASTAYDMDGIEDDWRDGDDAFDGASSTTYSAIAEIEAIKDQLTLIPFYSHQEDVITNYGLTLEFEQPLNGDMSLGFEGTYAVFKEESKDPTDEDASSYIAHVTLSYQDFWAGVGYFVMSDDLRVDPKAVGNKAFDPMEEGVYGGDPDDHTVFIDAGYSHGPFEVEIIFGDTKIDSSATGDEQGCKELDIYFTYEITEAFGLELMYVNVNDDDSDLDYQVFAGGISMTF